MTIFQLAFVYVCYMRIVLSSFILHFPLFFYIMPYTVPAVVGPSTWNSASVAARSLTNTNIFLLPTEDFPVRTAEPGM